MSYNADELIKQCYAILQKSAAHGRVKQAMDFLKDKVQEPLEPRLQGLMDQLIVALPVEKQLAQLRRYAGLGHWRDLLAQEKYQDPLRLEKYGTKYFSQNDEDGILQEIFRRIGTKSRVFVEFGVENGLENNSLFLLLQGWNGVWMECVESQIQVMHEKFAPWLAKGQLRVKHALVTRENFNTLLDELGLAGEIDLLCIDIDGNDYHVLESMNRIQPRVLVVEYNGFFPPPIRAVVPYDPNFRWNGSTYYGTSLESLVQLANKMGYQLVGTSICGFNAFFVRQEEAGDLFATPATAQHLYNPQRMLLLYSGTFATLESTYGGYPLEIGPWMPEE